MFIKLLGDCFSSCDLWTSDVCWEGCCAPTLPGLVSLCAECTEELLSDFETFCSDCCWSEYGQSNFCCEADGLLRICGVAFSDHRVGWEEPCCCCCCASNCFCSLGGCCAIGTLELWVPDLELPTTPVLPPFMNWGGQPLSIQLPAYLKNEYDSLQISWLGQFTYINCKAVYIKGKPFQPCFWWQKFCSYQLQINSIDLVNTITLIF